MRAGRAILLLVLLVHTVGAGGRARRKKGRGTGSKHSSSRHSRKGERDGTGSDDSGEFASSPERSEEMLTLRISTEAEAAIVLEVGAASADELLEAAHMELDALRFMRAAVLFKHAARHVLWLSDEAEKRDLETMVRGGLGLVECGEVIAAGHVLREALWHPHGQKNIDSQLWTDGAAALALAHAWDSTATADQVIDSIEVAGDATPPPSFSWFVLAVNIIKFQLRRDREAARLLEKAVLRTEAGGLQLHRPSVLSKLRWLVKRRRHVAPLVGGEDSMLTMLEARLRQEPLPPSPVRCPTGDTVLQSRRSGVPLLNLNAHMHHAYAIL
jgi:hypothetical protein